MEKNREFSQEEKLSHCLDQLNEGNCPVISDPEIEELIEMAAVVQHTYAKQEIPRSLIDKMVTNLATELSEKKRKRRGQWVYGGLACAAATLLLVIGTQFLVPQSLEKNIAQEMDGTSKVENIVAVADQSMVSSSQVTNRSIGESPKKSSIENIQPTTTQETGEKGIDSISKVVVDLIQVAQVMPTEEPTGQVAIAAKEDPQEKALAQNFAMSRMGMTPPMNLKKSNIATMENVMLVQPNKVAQSITVDHNSGTIRQVYTEGAGENIIITQRTITDHEAMASASQEDVKSNKVGVGMQVISPQDKKMQNSLTVTFEKYSITAEGNKTRAELQKIIDSLIVKKMEE